MKEQFTDEMGHTWTFSRWRIAPPGHPLPCPMENMTHIPPEGIFVNEEGLEVGLHPDSPWTCDGEYKYPEPRIQEEVIYQIEPKLNSKARKRKDRKMRFKR